MLSKWWLIVRKASACKSWLLCVTFSLYKAYQGICTVVELCVYIIMFGYGNICV